MYSGKTSTLLSMVEIYTLGRKNIKVFKPLIDNRYSTDHVVSHTGQKVLAVNVKSSAEVTRAVEAESGRLDAVFIDEVNFFDPQLLEVVQQIIFDGIDVFCWLDITTNTVFRYNASLMPYDDCKKKRSAMSASTTRRHAQNFQPYR
jgi:thymidine kinase